MASALESSPHDSGANSVSKKYWSEIFHGSVAYRSELLIRSMRKNHLHSQYGGEFGSMLEGTQIFRTRTANRNSVYSKNNAKVIAPDCKMHQTASRATDRRKILRNAVVRNKSAASKNAATAPPSLPVSTSTSDRQRKETGVSQSRTTSLSHKKHQSRQSRRIDPKSKGGESNGSLEQTNVARLKTCLNAVLRKHVKRSSKSYASTFSHVKKIFILLLGTSRLKSKKMSKQDLLKFIQNRIAGILPDVLKNNT